MCPFQGHHLHIHVSELLASLGREYEGALGASDAAGSYTKEAFPFYTEKMWDYEFQMHFAKWLHQRKDAVRTCFLIGIRTQESFNRWRSIHLNRKYQMYHNYRWTSKIGNDIFNAYPIYDWKTTDIWTANGKFGFDYNHLYDLYYKAGVNIERQRVASPFLCEAQESLALYKVIDPNTWGKMIGRVNGVNFTGIYGGTHAMGWQSVRIPEGIPGRAYAIPAFHLARRDPAQLSEEADRQHRILADKRGMLGREHHKEAARCRHSHRSDESYQLQDKQETCPHGLSG